MARSFSNAKLLSAFIVDRFSVAASRRGYAAAAQGGRSSVIVKKGEESTKTRSWSPDPITGYYRPDNHAKEIDVAELRETLLNHKINRP
ncbi:late embryogenesis abundant protein Lea5-like [Cornus florida]|uniref:late embryogenesis abundant protein Lea5-like n=1 Tax=Cornus florida TaxID=4283 RepID=UPI0028A2179E|nr:late embryogenesis abundant protein Lea5-like [Cornus florida]